MSRPFHTLMPSYPGAALFVLALGGCGSGGTDPTPPSGTPASITITAGNQQQAASGTTVVVAPAVVVKDAQGQPMAGIGVQFAVAAGGGTVTGAAATSDGAGVARPTQWTLGRSGEQRLTATAGSLAPVTFHATITPGTETITSTIGLGGGTIQVTTPGHPLQGLAVTVPAGSYAVSGDMSLRILPNATVPALATGYRVVGPVIEVTTSQGRASNLMTVQVPVSRAANEDVVLVLHDPIRQVTEVLLTVARGATSITAMTAHLRADLLIGPTTGSTLRSVSMASANSTGWLMAVAFPLPQPEVTVPVTRWPVLDHGSALSPNGFGPGIPALLALQAASRLQSFAGRFQALATPGFYAEAAPMAAAAMAQATLDPKVKSALGQALSAIGQLTKSSRDEMLHRNHVASMALTAQSMLTGLVRNLQSNDVIYGNSVSGTETSLGVVHPGLSGVAAIARNALTGYAATSMPITPDQPTVSVESAVPLTSFLVPFEEIRGHLAGLLETLALPARSAERKAKNKLMAQLAGLIQPILEAETIVGEGWYPVDPGPIPIRNTTTRVRSTGNNPAELSVHDEAGAVVVTAVATPIATDAIVTAQAVAQPKAYVVSGVQTTGGRQRQTAPVEEELVRVPFKIVPGNFALIQGASEVTFDAAVPFPPQGGFRIRWNWGDGQTTVVSNNIRAVHDYAQVQDREVIASLLPISSMGTNVLVADTATVSGGQPFWKITSMSDADEFYALPLQPGEVDDVLYRIITQPSTGLFGLVPVPGGRELRLYVKGSGTWTASDCCPPTFTPADEHLMIAEDPRVLHGELGAFWSAWRDTGLIFGGTISDGSFSGRSIGPKRQFVVEDGGIQIGTEYGLEFNLNMNDTGIFGTMYLVIWGIDDETGEVELGSEQRFRFIVSGVRLK